MTLDYGVFLAYPQIYSLLLEIIPYFRRLPERGFYPMIKRLLLFCLVAILFNFRVLAQIGGENTYQFLELANSARVAALGGTLASSADQTDLNLSFNNPALLDSNMSNVLLFNYVNYISDIQYGYISYSRSFGNTGNFAVGMNYMNYGKFSEATELGELTGNSFKAAEYALNLIYSNHFRKIHYGVNLKPILSRFENYQSIGIACDFGINYMSANGLSSFGIVARNAGGQLTTYYTDGQKESIPFNLLAGFSKKLQHAPVILTVSMQNLTNWDLANTETSTSTASATNEIEIYEREEGFARQIMRHTILGVELVPTQNFTIRAGYNYQRRQELKFDEKLSTVGLSLGFGVKIRKFRFDFATSRFHLAASSNLFSLAYQL